MTTIVIPPLENGECPAYCPFRESDDVGARCSLHLEISLRRFHMKPGPECPGPGEFTLVPKDRKG